MPSKSNPIISSHRDAATRVSKYLSETHGVQLKPIAALEIVARALGANNWQTLKAMAEQGRAPRQGDGVWYSGNPAMLPDIGEGAVTSFLSDVQLQHTPRPTSEHLLVYNSVLDEQMRNLGQRLGQSANAPGTVDLRFDRSDVQSMEPEKNSSRVWRNLVRRAVKHEISPSDLGDIELQLDRVMTEMKVVLSLTQREAVRQALLSPVSICSGYSDSGKGIIAEALLRTAEAFGVRKVINARHGDNVPLPLDGATFRAPEYRPLNVGGEYHPLSIVRLGPLLAECEMLVIDEHVACDKYLFWDVLQAAPATCRIVVLGQLSLDDGSEMSRVFNDLVKNHHVKFVQLHEVLRQQHMRFIGLADLEHEFLEAAHQSDYTTTDVKVVSNPRGYTRGDDVSSVQAGVASDSAVTVDASIPPTNDRSEEEFLPTVRPTEAWNVPGFVYGPGSGDFVSNQLTGKWCIICDASTVNALWEKVCQEIRTYRLLMAMASSPNNARAHGGSYVICVFTADWADEDDVMRARKVLRELGVTQEIGYKRDIETFNNVYGVPEEWRYRA